MKQNRINTFLALLLVPTLTCCMAASVGQAQARVESATTVVNTVLRPSGGTAFSDCLREGENQIILLGSLGAGDAVYADFSLEAIGTVSGPLVMTVTDEAQQPIQADVQLLYGEALLEENRLEMEAGAEAVLRLTVTAPESTGEGRTAQVRVDVEGLTGIFRVELEPDPMEPEQDPEETEPEVPETEPQEPSLEMPDLERPGNQIPPTEQIIDPAVSEETEPDVTYPESVELTLTTTAEFEVTNRLPLKLTASGTAEYVRIGLDGEQMLPEKVRYSCDGGQSWYMLYFGGYLEDPAGEMILLDFSASELTPDEELVLQAQAFSQSLQVGEATAATMPRETREQIDWVPILTTPDAGSWESLTGFLDPADPEEDPTVPQMQEPDQEQPAEPENTEEAELLPEPAEDPEFAWNTDHWFSIALPAGWRDCQEIRFSAELLKRNEEGAGAYEPVAWDPETLNGRIHEETENLIVYLGTHTPRAGSYRLTLECIFEGNCFHREQMTFFINYSTRSDELYEEVPDNE